MPKKLKEKSDDLIMQKAKTALIDVSEKNGIQIQEILTPAVEKKLDGLLKTVLQEHGYKKLVSLGLKHIL
ncbi:MAG: hypothetical protein V2J08_06040 [Desulfotignum sp.]|jgi:hypothetical protein|nr:hypothetical protein [Desulfotignum sp.]